MSNCRFHGILYRPNCRRLGREKQLYNWKNTLRCSGLTSLPIIIHSGASGFVCTHRNGRPAIPCTSNTNFVRYDSPGLIGVINEGPCISAGRYSCPPASTITTSRGLGLSGSFPRCGPAVVGSNLVCSSTTYRRSPGTCGSASYPADTTE